MLSENPMNNEKCQSPYFWRLFPHPGQCCGYGMLLPIQIFFIPDAESGSRVKKIQDPLQRLNVFVIQKVVSKLWEIWSGMFILDPGSRFFTHPGSMDQKSTKKHWIRIRNTFPGTGYSPDVAIPYFYTNLPVPRVTSQIPQISRSIISPHG